VTAFLYLEEADEGEREGGREGWGCPYLQRAFGKIEGAGRAQVSAFPYFEEADEETVHGGHGDSKSEVLEDFLLHF